MRSNQPTERHSVNKQVIPFYPILFGIYPVLALAASAGDTSQRAAQPGAFQDYLIRGDRDAMLRSIHRLASVLNSQSAAPEPTVEKG